MATYQVSAPDGSQYEVSGDEADVQSTIHSILGPQSDSPSFDAGKAASNIIPDIKQMVQNAGNTAQTWAPVLGGDVGSAIPGLIKQGSQMLANPQQTAQSIARPVLHPLAYAEEHPVQQALNVLGAGQLAAQGVGTALNAIPATENIVPSIERVANNQTLKGFGGTMGQLKQMEQAGGQEALDKAAQYARDNGLSDVFSTEIGRRQLLNNLLQKTGQAVGALRTQAGDASPSIIGDAINNPKANIDQYLGNGLDSGQLPQFDKAISDVQRIAGPNPTHADIAEAATYINKHAAGNKLYQPQTAATDFANALSDQNNQGIAQSLGSDKAQQYVQALQDQQTLHPLEHLQEKGELRQAGGRGGIGLQMVQKLADEFGYRLTAKAASALADTLNGNVQSVVPAVASNAVISNAPQNSNILNLIQQLKQKYNQGGK